ncbi:PAS domain S-box protein [Haloarcula sp. S1CR25-12]|uniref:PAS domain S-box protein n=1 Tax=Haloarcula saliterrae TaxID=2950534 RepID=A0ABU2FAW5_9EURY|nr:PAS domain S-box protein [Haloarcula sp. S1CR25-12]MDS0259342.1 PAS domain S-box protein [Haloarcula sp. S1CR25-12]
MDTIALSDGLRQTLGRFDADGTPLTTPEVAAELDVGRRTTYARLERLVEADRLATKKVGASARVWWRPPASSRDGDSGSLAPDILDAVDAALVVVDADGEVAWVNDAAERYFGLDRDAVLGRPHRWLAEERLAGVVSDGDSEAVLATGAGEGGPGQFDCHVTDGPDREERWLEHHSEPIESGPHAGGRVERYDDITERKRETATGSGRSETLQSLVEAVEEYAIFTLDTEGRVRTWNPGAERIKGYEAEGILGEHVSVFYTDEDRAAGVPEANLAAARAEGSVEDEGWRVRADGSRFWANVTITAIRDDDGDLDGYAKVTRDMTERKHAEAERELLYDTTRSVAAAETFEAGLQAALADICAVTDWEYAEAWMPTDEGELRRAPADYHADDLASFADFSESFRFDPGEGLPGRVYESGTYEWATDLEAGSREVYPRLAAALDAGLVSSLGVPVVADGDTVAVLTFLLGERRQTDERLVRLVSSVAAELGELLGHRQAEERLKRERELLERVFETAPIGLAEFGPDRDVVRANGRLADIVGLSTENIDDYTVGDLTLLDPDDEPLSVEELPIGQVFETGAPVFDQKVQCRRDDGTTRWLSVDATPVTDDGELSRVVAAVTDITRLVEQAEQLERQRDELDDELREVFARIDDAFMAVDEMWRFTHVNEQAARLLDRPVGELIGRNIWEEFPEAEGSVFQAEYERALQSTESVTFEEYYAPLDTWFEVAAYPSETGLSVYFRDVTDRKRRERELEEYERIVETVADGIYVLDEDDRFQQVNDAFVSMTRFDRTELLGSHASAVFGDGFEERGELARGETGDDRDVAVFEEELYTADGDAITVESRFSQFAVDGGEGRAGVVRDITERIERQQELELYATITETVPDGVYALDGDDRFVLVNEAFCELVGYDREELLGERPTLINSETVNERANELEQAVTEGDREVGTLEFEFRTASGDRVPVEGHFRPYSYRDVSGRCGVARDMTDRVERERKLERQREQLTALNSLNRVVREITEAVIEQSTREEIERSVCELLADSESYMFAWIGDADPESQTVNLRTEAGVEGYLDDITISVDPEDDRSEGPTGRAFRTGEVETTRNLVTDSRYEPWRDYVEAYGFRSSAAIPVVHDGTTYGVLNVYAQRPSAFEGEEREMVGQLGEIVGHAIAAVERKQALLSDEVVELSFQMENAFASMGMEGPNEGTIELEHTVSIDEGEFVLFGRASPAAADTVERMVEAFPYYETVSFREDGERFELRVSEPPILSAIASLGGSVETAVVEDGSYQLTVHLSPTADVSRVIDAVKDRYPDATLLKRRQLTKRDRSGSEGNALTGALTDRQLTVLETAYYAGFFEWPRAASGETVAESLGVAPPTFHQHLRKAERKVFDRVFATGD